MNEHESNHREREVRAQQKREYIRLGQELAEVREGFPFQGVSQEYYNRAKAVEKEYPDAVTPIDELINMFKEQGMRVSFGEHPESGMVYIMPLNSGDIRNDAILPRDLLLTDRMDERLMRLIAKNIEQKNW